MLSFITYKLFGAQSDLVLFEKRKFNCESVKTCNHLEKIGTLFLHGYNNCLQNSRLDSITDIIKGVDLEFQGFVFEGIAMGLELIDQLPFQSRNRVNCYLNNYCDCHIYMMHIGAGWALARLPLNIEKAIRKFDPLLRWLTIDGYGFHQAYFHTNRYVNAGKLPSNLSLFAKHVFYQGVGRCLWFVEGAQPERIAWRILQFPEEFHPDLWAGIGLACSYAGGVAKDTLLKIQELGSEFKYELAQGACFAAKARQRAGNLVPHTNVASHVFCNLSAEAAAKVTDDCLVNL